MSILYALALEAEIQTVPRHQPACDHSLFAINTAADPCAIGARFNLRDENGDVLTTIELEPKPWL